MKAEADVSGRVNQWSRHTLWGLASICGKLKYVVGIDPKIKKEIRAKYGDCTDFVDKFHCVGLYYLIKPNLNYLSELMIDRDMNKKKILKYLKDYFGSSKEYNQIFKDVISVGKSSPADKLIRKKRLSFANYKLTFSDVDKFFRK